MRKLLLISILLISIILLSGCGTYNINFFTLPNDTEFLALVQELDTPYKIGQYMIDNFIYKYHSFYAPDPYILWQIQKGDCNDFSTFATFIANYHGYETYQMYIIYKASYYNHSLAVYKENDKYNISNNQFYIFIEATNFIEIANRYNYPSQNIIWSKYIVYDYEMNVIEQIIK